MRPPRSGEAYVACFMLSREREWQGDLPPA